MNRKVKRKTEFILFWFRSEKPKLSFYEQKVLIDKWIEVLIESEEYEMASALRDEKLEVIKEYVKKKRRRRTLKERFKYFRIKISRKIKGLKKK
jgi:hypothetical protein